MRPIPLFDEAETAALCRWLVATEALSGGKLDKRQNAKPHLLFPWLADLVRDARIVDAVEDVLGADIFCRGSSSFTKEPGDGTSVSWHQDQTYWGLSSADITTAWVAFTPSLPISGCLRVVPGTHLDQLAHNDTFAADDLLPRGQEITVAVAEATSSTSCSRARCRSTMC